MRGKQPLAAGDATIELDFAYQGEAAGGPAALTLKVNGEILASGQMSATVGGRFGIDTFGVGEDSGQPVTPAYQPPFAFNGNIEEVVIEVK